MASAPVVKELPKGKEENLQIENKRGMPAGLKDMRASAGDKFRDKIS
jgi:hypothetical protein